MFIKFFFMSWKYARINRIHDAPSDYRRMVILTHGWRPSPPVGNSSLSALTINKNILDISTAWSFRPIFAKRRIPHKTLLRAGSSKSVSGCSYCTCYYFWFPFSRRKSACWPKSAILFSSDTGKVCRRKRPGKMSSRQNRVGLVIRVAFEWLRRALVAPPPLFLKYATIIFYLSQSRPHVYSTIDCGHLKSTWSLEFIVYRRSDTGEGHHSGGLVLGCEKRGGAHTHARALRICKLIRFVHDVRDRRSTRETREFINKKSKKCAKPLAATAAAAATALRAQEKNTGTRKHISQLV